MQLKTILAASVVVSFGAVHAFGDIVYSNAVNYSGIFLNPGLSEVGDEIILAPGGPRTASTFRFEYYGDGLDSGTVANQFQIRFYDNSTLIPNDLGMFYDSGLIALPTPDNASGRNTLEFDLSSLNLTLPEDFTWSIQFSGIEAGETAGVTIYDPATVGTGYDDYWLRNGGGNWVLMGTNVPISFGAAFTAVPEPSTYVLAILGGICGLALVNRRNRKR